MERGIQGENCVMGSREQKPWWEVYISHVKAFEFYNSSPAQMDYLRTQTHHLVLRPMPFSRLFPLPGIVFF